MSALPSLRAVSTALAVTALALSAQSGGRCGAPAPSAPQSMRDSPSDCAYFANSPLPRYAPGFVFRIPVVVHTIVDTAGRGSIPMAAVRRQIEELNEDFRARPGTSGAAGIDTRIEFHLATQDPLGRPTEGVTVTVNDIWFRDRGNYWDTLAWDTNRYLNLYTNFPGQFTLGYVPEFPASGTLVGTTADRVVVNYTAFGAGREHVCTHEVGHYLGLLHTFTQDCVSGPCATTGDLICDTPVHMLTGCAATTSCGAPPPHRNYMNYTSCPDRFTFEQAARMRCTLENWRPALAARCAIAAATPRNSGANPASLASNRPILGADFRVTLDVAATGHAWGVFVGGIAPVDLPWNGFRLLIDLASPPGGLFTLPAQPGPLASYVFPLPDTPSLCGVGFTLQGAHLGGTGQPPVVLSNALDVMLGRD